ncbi:MAG: hypothetical protein ACOYNS_07825 [Bacteroidota bacterium]
MMDLVSMNIQSKYYVVPGSELYGYAGQLQFFVTMKNNTDETLEDIARLDGTMSITWVPRPGEGGNFTFVRTVPMTRSNIFYAKSYNPVTRKLILAPNDSVVLSFIWNLKTDDSTNLFLHMNEVTEPSCIVYRDGSPPGNRRFTSRQRFTVAAGVKIFDRLVFLNAQPITVSYCIKERDRGEANKNMGLPPCADLNKFDPCSLTGQ